MLVHTVEFVSLRDEGRTFKTGKSIKNLQNKRKYTEESYKFKQSGRAAEMEASTG